MTSCNLFQWLRFYNQYFIKLHYYSTIYVFLLNIYQIRVARSKFEQKPRLISPKTQQNPDFPPKNPVKTHIVLVIYQAVRLWKPV